MNPAEALNILDQISRIAPIVYEAQLQRCKAVEVLRALIDPPKEAVQSITADAAELGA